MKGSRTAPGSGGLSRRRLLRWAGAVGVAGLGGGLSGCSDRPDEDILDTGTEPTVVQQGGVVSGTVVGLFDGNPVGGATVAIGGLASVTTDAAGRFSARIPRSGDFGVRISRTGFVTRRSAVRLRSNVDAAVSLIEEGPDLDLDFLDQFARAAGPRREAVPRTPGRSNRWTRPPRVLIYRRFESAAGSSAVVTLSDRRVELIEISIDDVFVGLTAGRLGGTPTPIVLDQLPPRNPRRVPAGSLAVFQTDDGSRGAGNVGSIDDEFAIASAHAFTDFEAPRNILHKFVGHALGAWDVSDDFKSVMGSNGRLTLAPQDIAAATVLYSRRPGNGAPDTDPPGTFLDG